MESWLGGRWIRLLAALALVLVLDTHGVRRVGAQGPECPPGFVWQRMSGVGCVQEGCLDIANAKYTYTSACACVEGFQACYEPADYAGFDRAKCGPNCPISKLVSCVSPGAPCPGAESPPTSIPAPLEPTATASQPPGPSLPSVPTEPSSALSIDGLVRDLERFLAGHGVRGPTPGQSAAGAAAVSSLVGAWVLTNLLSGARLDDLLKAVAEWRRRGSAVTPAASAGAPTGPTVDRIYDGTKARKLLDSIDPSILRRLHRLDPQDPDFWSKRARILDRAGTASGQGRRLKGISFDWKKDPGGKQVVDEDSIVIVVEEPEYGPARRPPTVSPVPPKTTPAAPGPPPAPCKPPSITTIYSADPTKFTQCQDIVAARLLNRPPPTDKQDKSGIYTRMVQAGYWQAHQGGMYDSASAQCQLSDLRDGDIIMFGAQALAGCSGSKPLCDRRRRQGPPDPEPSWRRPARHDGCRRRSPVLRSEVRPKPGRRQGLPAQTVLRLQGLQASPGLTRTRAGIRFTKRGSQAVNRVQSPRVCPNCGATNIGKQTICLRCRTPLTPSERATSPVCPSCGAYTVPRRRFCSACGVSLTGQAPGQAAATATDPSGSPQVRHEWRLTIVNGPRVGESFVLGHRMRIGRASDNEIHLASRQVSRHHAVLERAGTGYLVVDLGSGNGTYVNRVRIQQPTPLRDRDTIAIGDTRFALADEARQTPAGTSGTFACPACGARVFPGRNFCGQCGTRLTQGYHRG